MDCRFVYATKVSLSQCAGNYAKSGFLKYIILVLLGVYEFCF